MRSRSAMSTFGVASPMAKSSSSAVHSELSDTEIAPIDTIAAKLITHSG